jgi:hypothetical protein
MATPEPKLEVATEGGADSKLEHASGGDTSASMTSTGGHVSRLETEQDKQTRRRVAALSPSPPRPDR